MRCFSGFQRALTRRVSFRFVPDILVGLQDRTRTLPLRQKTSMPFAAVLTPSVRWRHGDNIPHFLNRETGTSAHCWHPALTCTSSELIIRGLAGSFPRRVQSRGGSAGGRAE